MNVDEYTKLSDSLREKIKHIYLSRQWVERFTVKTIEKFIFDLRVAFKEENINADIYYNPKQKEEKFIYDESSNINGEIIGIAIAFKDENNNKVKSVELYDFLMPRIKIRH